MKNEQRLKRARRWSIFALLALVLGLLATQPNVASETQEEAWRHTAECIGWFFNDPERHERECVGDNERERPKTLVPGEPYTPPPPPMDYDCHTPQVIGNAGNGTINIVATGNGGYPCPTSGVIAPLVLGLFSSGHPVVS